MIRPLPKKLTELGRIRIGWQEPNKRGGGKHPAKLAEFRLTSNNKPLLHYAAQLYGGDVRPWEDAPNAGQFELFTQANAIDVLIPTESAVRVSYEIWSGGGCQRRCDGCLITHSAVAEQVLMACDCPEDDHQRSEMAKDGKACARILRLNVLLPDLPGMGVWRLETKGYYATAELLGTLEMLSGVGMAHTIIEAVLRLEQRMVKREGKTLRFATPVLWPKWTPRQLLAGSSAALIEAPVSSPDVPQLSAPEALASLSAELFGDRAAAPAPIDSARASAIGQEIEQLCGILGYDEAKRDAYWVHLSERYPDLTPGALSIVRDYLQQKVQAQTAPQEGSETPTMAAEDIPF